MIKKMPIINRDIKQQTPEWHAKKLGKPSASNARRIITTKGAPSKSMDLYAKDLAYELLASESASNFTGNESTDYGNEMEPVSLLSYSMLTGFELESVGFIEDDREQYIISPDSLVIGQKRGVEAKNKPKLHGKAVKYYEKHGKIPSDYVLQLQMSLYVADFDLWDIYYYHPTGKCIRATTEPDPVIFRAFDMYLPELLYKRDKILESSKEF